MSLEKFEAINNQMNKITKEFMANVQMSEEVLTTTEEMSAVFEGLKESKRAAMKPPKDPSGSPKSPPTVETSDHPSPSSKDPVVPTSVDLTDGLVEILPAATDTDDAPELISASQLAAEIFNIEAMQADFEYMRNTLRETTENSRRVLDSVTEELIHSDDESRAGLVMAFSDLNKAQLEGIKLFMQSYKEISAILVNFAKVNKDSNTGPTTSYTTNVLSLEGAPGGTSVADIVSRIRKPMGEDS